MCPSATSEVLEQWKSRLGQGFFLFVGVLRYYKGLHTLVEASVGIDVPVVIAGSGPERDALEAQARKQGNVSLVLQLSRGEALPQELPAADKVDRMNRLVLMWYKQQP